MWFSPTGMGHLLVTKDRLCLEEESEFLFLLLYAKGIHSRVDSSLLLTVYSECGPKYSQLSMRGHKQIENGSPKGRSPESTLSDQFQGRQVTVHSWWQRSCVGTDRLQVTGLEGTLFGHSVETPLVRADPFLELRLERVFICKLMLGKSRPFLKWT